MQYSKVRKWQVAPQTFAATAISIEDLKGSRDHSLMKSRASRASMQSVGKQKESKSSINKFDNSPSGKVLSEDRFKAGPQSRRIKTVGGSLSPTKDEAKSPFTSKSGRRSAATRNAQPPTIQIEDQKNNQLTIERVEAMRLMTKKLKKVAKVPVEFENKFCSHVDPITSANLIAANELAQQTQSKFKNIWKDKEHRPPREDYHQVPKHYYSNYKTNMIRDAHYMAKRIVENVRS